MRRIAEMKTPVYVSINVTVDASGFVVVNVQKPVADEVTTTTTTEVETTREVVPPPRKKARKR
jgi:hypothetical protein